MFFYRSSPGYACYSHKPKHPSRKKPNLKPNNPEVTTPRLFHRCNNSTCGQTLRGEVVKYANGRRYWHCPQCFSCRPYP